MLALALLTFWLERTVREDEAPAGRSAATIRTTIVSNFTTTNYNRDGARRDHAVGGEDGTLPGRRHDRAARAARGADQAERAAHDACAPSAARSRSDGDEVFLYGNVRAGARGRRRSAPRRA